jgi:alpha-N-arabinofuranosidase
MEAGVTAPAAVRQISLPAEARAISTLSRIDYSDAFVVDAGVELGPERWARAMVADAPLAMRVRLLSGWTALGLRLGLPWAADRVLGWRVRESKPGFVLLRANSWLGMKAELLFCVQPRGVLFATLIQQKHALARGLWRKVAPTHQAVVRSLLLNAARREADRPRTSAAHLSGEVRSPQTGRQPRHRRHRAVRPSWPAGRLLWLTTARSWRRSVQFASVVIDPAFTVAPVRRQLFGSFVEHLGRCVYTGIYEPEHPTATPDGFRRDVLDLVSELGISTVRYPGGNFVSGYRWEDGIGPRSQRPVRRDLAWHCTEPNIVGVDEFMRWARAARVEPMMAVNLGTRGVQDALNLLEYCNGAAGAYYSDLRARNGSPEPYGIRMWCLGNEMDGLWQIGHKTAHEYGRLAAETARAMRMADPGLTLVACGSSSAELPTFGAWEATVLGEAYDEVDLISAHAYYCERDGDLASFLASGVGMDAFIESVTAAADYVRAVKKSAKRVDISFDEWNVWYQEAAASRPPSQDWPVAPALLEDNYSIADAVVVGSLLISLLRHSDRVASASMAQLVNVIAPIMTIPGGPAWRQTIFHPFVQASQAASGVVLRAAVDTPRYDCARYGDVPVLDAVATHDRDTGQTAVFAVNRSVTEPVVLQLSARAFGKPTLSGATQLSDANPRRRVSAEDAHLVTPRRNDDTSWDGQTLNVTLPPVSWNVIRLTSAESG